MNEAVRVADGVDDSLVVVAAFCPTCGQESMPMLDGRCPWCHTRIVDEATLSARAMVEQLGRPQLHAVPTEPALPPSGRGFAWTRETAIAAVQAFASEHGHPPSRSATLGNRSLPSGPSAVRLFGSWGNLIEQAGYPRPTRGTNYRRKPLDETGTTDGSAPPVSSSGPNPEPPETVKRGEGQPSSTVPRQPQAKDAAELPSRPGPLDPSPNAQIAYHVAAALEHLAAAARTWGAAQ